MISSSTTTWDVLVRAHDALRAVTSAVPESSWELETPCEGWTVTQVLQHSSGDQQGFAAVLTGVGFPTDDPFSPSGILTTTPSELLEPSLTAAAAAFAEVPMDATGVAVPLPGGPFSAATAVGACALDAAVHAWDIAVATGQASPIDERLALDLMVVAIQIVPPLRGFAYAPAIEGPSGSPLDSLLRYLGRRPEWVPAT